MSYNGRKHSALPAEPGWYLFERKGEGKPWRCGYNGKHHAHFSRDFATEQVAILYIKGKHEQLSDGGGIMQAWLCGRV